MRLLAYIFFTILITTSCITQKKALNKTVTALSSVSVDRLLKKHYSIKTNSRPFKQSSKVTLTTETQKRNVNVDFIVLPKEQVFLNLSYMGFSVAKANFLKDSVFVLEKVQYSYLSEDYAYIERLLKVDFADLNNLQAFLNGKFFMNKSQIKNIKSSVEGLNYKLTFDENKEQQTYWKTGEVFFDADFLMQKIKLFNGEKVALEVGFNNWKTKEKFWYFGTMIISIPAKKTVLEIENKEPKKWKKGVIPFNIPKGYKKMGNLISQNIP